MIKYVIKRTVFILKKLKIILSVSSFLLASIISALICISIWANKPRNIRIPLENTSIV